MKKKVFKKKEITLEDLYTLTKDNSSEIDNLARMTARGFLDVQNEMNNRFKAVDKRFDKVEDRLDRIENYVISHEKRISILEDKISLINLKIGLKK